MENNDQGPHISSEEGSTKSPPYLPEDPPVQTKGNENQQEISRPKFNHEYTFMC